MEQESTARRQLLRAASLVGASCLVGGLGAGAVQAAPETPPASGALTGEGISQFLKNLGYEVEDKKSDSGSPYCVATWKQDTWTFRVSVSLSANKAFVWLTMALTTIPDPAKIPPKVLLTLLTENDTIGPTHFSYSETGKRFYLNRALDNRDVTPVRFRQEADAMAEIIKRTENLWSPTKWT